MDSSPKFCCQLEMWHALFDHRSRWPLCALVIESTKISFLDNCFQLGGPFCGILSSGFLPSNEFAFPQVDAFHGCVLAVSTSPILSWRVGFPLVVTDACHGCSPCSQHKISHLPFLTKCHVLTTLSSCPFSNLDERE